MKYATLATITALTLAGTLVSCVPASHVASVIQMQIDQLKREIDYLNRQIVIKQQEGKKLAAKMSRLRQAKERAMKAPPSPTSDQEQMCINSELVTTQQEDARNQKEKELLEKQREIKIKELKNLTD